MRLGRRDSSHDEHRPLAARSSHKRRCSGGSQTAWRGLAAHANSSSGAAVDAALNALSGTGGAAQPGGARSATQDETRSSRLGRTMSTDLATRQLGREPGREQTGAARLGHVRRFERQRSSGAALPFDNNGGVERAQSTEKIDRGD